MAKAVFNKTETAYDLNCTEKTIDGLVTQQAIPYRMLGKRIIFLQREIDEWLQNLPGVTVAEALQCQEPEPEGATANLSIPTSQKERMKHAM